MVVTFPRRAGNESMDERGCVRGGIILTNTRGLWNGRLVGVIYVIGTPDYRM